MAAIKCDNCMIEVQGRFVFPSFLHLSAEQQQFALDFLRASGSLKQVAADYGVPFPTVRARLDRIIEIMKGEASDDADRRAAVLDAVEDKRISPQEASRLLGGVDRRIHARNGFPTVCRRPEDGGHRH